MTSPLSGTQRILQTEAKEQVSEAAEKALEQEESIVSIQKGMEEEGNPVVAALKTAFKSIAKLAKPKVKTKSEVGGQKPLTSKQAADMAGEFEKENPSMKSKDLLALLDRLNPGDSKEKILELVYSQYLDLNQAEIALKFLERATGGDLKKNVQEAQKELFTPINSINSGDDKDQILKVLNKYYPHARLVDQALNKLLKSTERVPELHKQVQSAKMEHEENNKGLLAATGEIQTKLGSMQKAGLAQTAKEVSDMYLDLKSNPMETQTLFTQLQKMTFKQQMAYLGTMESMIGKELKTKGTRIEGPELGVLFNQVRTLQAIFFVYRICQNNMPFIHSQLGLKGLSVPPQLTHDFFAKNLMAVIAERYPSPEKISSFSDTIGMKEIEAKLILGSVLLRIFPQLSPNKIYRSKEHLDQLIESTIKFNDRVEEEVERLEEERAAAGDAAAAAAPQQKVKGPPGTGQTQAAA